MFEYLQMLLRTGNLAPHGYCLMWQPELVWTHVLADGLIAAAYFSIPIAIVRFVRRRPDIEFSWMFWLFALFITACGTTHLMSIWTLWNPDYGWEAVIKVITAIASVGTAIALWPLIPKALAIPSPLQLKQANSELTERVRERDAALSRLQQEITERQRAEDALLQAQKMDAVGQLTGGIAHDFNNLLQGVAGALDLIARNPGDPEKVRKWAQRGREAADRGTRLTGQLLAFSRVQKLDLKPVAVQPLVSNLLDLLSRTIGSGVRIETDFADGGAAVLADKTQLELAIINLAINARDAMPDGGTLTISTARAEPQDGEDFPGGAIEIRVADTGTGMSEEVLERAFEPFFTTKGVGKGTGLGLSMVYGVAAQSGGRARIESAPGAGTTVIVTLRRAAAEAAEAEPLAEIAAERRGRGETVLVVDDDDTVRATVRDGLEALGYRVAEASSGTMAVALAEKSRPDLVVMDFAMPGLNGAEAARRLSELHPGLKILFASGYADTVALEAALGPGTPVLRKPFHLHELAAAVADRLEDGGG